jgi:rhodanese-related sulfurtransferase
VREPEETEALPWPLPPGSGPLLKIPLDDLRGRLAELDKERRIMILCARGPRSFQAAAILRQAGFDDVHLVGGGITALHPAKPGPG